MSSREPFGISAHHKVIAAFVLAVFADNNPSAQRALHGTRLMVLFNDLLLREGQCDLLRLWLVIVMARLWTNFDDVRVRRALRVPQARLACVRNNTHEHLMELAVTSPSGRLRAACLHALGTLMSNCSANDEHATEVSEVVDDRADHV